MNMRYFITTALALCCSLVFAQKTDSLHLAAGDSISHAPLQPAGQDSLLQIKQGKSDKSLKIGAAPQLADTTSSKPKKAGFLHRTFSKKYPNPRTAALFSMVLPGAGQAYNKKWWKVPIVWGALAGIGYFTFDTQNTYRELRDAYKISTNGGTPEAPYDAFDATRLRSYRDTFRGYTEKWYLALGITYLLSVTDAFVDAHLARFDVSDDLSLRFKPSFENAAGMPSFGLGLAFNFSAKSPSKPPIVRP